MQESSTFQIILLIVFGFIAVLAVLMFSGIIPGGASFMGTKEAGTVVLWGPYPSDTLASYFSDLNKVNSSAVQIKYVYKAPETYTDTLVEAFARASGPDLFFADQTMLNRLTGKTADIPFTIYPERSFIDTFADGASVFTNPTGLSALPLFIDPLVMYYNRTLYSSAGIVSPPKTWKDFVATAGLINKQDSQNNFLFTAAPLGEFRNITNAKAVLSSLIFQAGNPISDVDGDGNYYLRLSDGFGFNPPPAETALTFYLSFSNPTLDTYSWNRSMAEDKDMFVAEKSAVYFGFSSELADLKSKNPHLNLDASPVPQSDLRRQATFGNFEGVMIANNSSQKDLAMTAAGIIASTENLKTLASLLSLVPARRDLLSAPVADPWGQVFRSAAVNVRSWVDPEPATTQAVLGQMIDSVQTGQSSAASGIQEANGKINTLFIKK